MPDAVRVEHGDDFEDEVLAEELSKFGVGGYEGEEAVEDVTRDGLSRMNSSSDHNRLFLPMHLRKRLIPSRIMDLPKQPISWSSIFRVRHYIGANTLGYSKQVTLILPNSITQSRHIHILRILTRQFLHIHTQLRITIRQRIREVHYILTILKFINKAQTIRRLVRTPPFIGPVLNVPPVSLPLDPQNFRAPH